MDITNLPLGPLGTNCYIVSNKEEAIIIDPGGDSDKLIKTISDKQLSPSAIMLTHAHFDHIGAVDEIREHYRIPVYVHELEGDWLPNPNLNGSALFQMGVISVKEADHYIALGEVKIGSIDFEVRYTPGHSPGSVSFIFHEDKAVICGDTLFHSGVGRTDLPGGEMEQLLHRIRTQLFTLPDDFTVFPGHGPSTTIAHEKKYNPFLQ